jgi:hypothetical protein
MGCENVNSPQYGKHSPFVGKVQKRKHPITGLGRPFGIQEFEAPKFLDICHMKVVRLSALRTGRLYPPRRYSWYSFLLEAELTLGPDCVRKGQRKKKPMTPSGIKPATFRLLA